MNDKEFQNMREDLRAVGSEIDRLKTENANLKAALEIARRGLEWCCGSCPDAKDFLMEVDFAEHPA